MVLSPTVEKVYSRASRDVVMAFISQSTSSGLHEYRGTLEYTIVGPQLLSRTVFLEVIVPQEGKDHLRLITRYDVDAHNVILCTNQFHSWSCF